MGWSADGGGVDRGSEVVDQPPRPSAHLGMCVGGHAYPQLMARDWEAWLATASGPASPTEEQERDRTEARIRDAIRGSDDLPESVRSYAKGSYANGTNVRRDADVDVAVEWNNSARVHTWGKTSNMTPAELGYTPVEDPMTKQDFRSLVEKALIAAFGAGPVDTTPDKCIGVAAGNSTLDADVVPCFALRRYDAPGVYHAGHRIFPKSGSHVDNFPQQNYDNGVTKNDQTSKRYKQIVRCVKRVEGELFDEGAIPRDYPGYLIECLVYNVPNDHFGHTKRYDDMRAVLAWLWNNLRDENVYNEWTEPSDLKWLFKNRPDRIPKNAFNLVDKAWDKMEFP